MNAIVVGTAGHIDHGKSALVKALTGTDPDRLQEEKTRGITIDLGFAHTEIGGCEIAFVDVPGHERFVKNMLAGVGGIDAVMLVVAADESVMPQTREHFAICRLLQIPAGVVVLTKADLADPDSLELARLEVRDLIKGSALEHAPVVAVSSKTGEGLDALRTALRTLADSRPFRRDSGLSRLPIDRVFSMRGFGTVVTGTLASGTIDADQELALLPSGRVVKVRGIQVHGKGQQSASAGRRVAVNLGGVEVADVRRGDTLAAQGVLESTRRFDAVIELLAEARVLRHGARVRFHHGAVELLGRVALASPADRPGGAIAHLLPGRSAYARLRLEAPAVLTRGDRFILRAYSPPTTIGGGRVLDPLPARTPIRTLAAAARFQRLNRDMREAAAVFVTERGMTGLTLGALGRRAGLDGAAARALSTDLVEADEAILIGDVLFSRSLTTTLQARLLTAVEQHHLTAPLSEGLPREEARERIFGAASAALFNYVLTVLSGEGRLLARERLSIPGRGVTLTAEETGARTALDRIFREAGLAPPDLSAAAANAGVSAEVAERITRLLLRQNVLVKLDVLFFHNESLTKLKQEVAALKGERGATVDVAAFKARYGISRKYAIPLLEWLDRERVTRRVGDSRTIL